MVLTVPCSAYRACFTLCVALRVCIFYQYHYREERLMIFP